jgi:DNA-binding transcriptional regulator YiaG
VIDLLRRKPAAAPFFLAEGCGTGLRPLPKKEEQMRKLNAMNSLTFAALVAVGLSTVALAQEQPAAPPPGDDMAMGFFDKVDANKDGKVTQDEIDAFKAARFAEADADKDGKLSAAELVAMREKMEAERKLARAEKMVERIDRNADGLLTPEELAEGPRPPSMIERMDTDGDGAVSKAEAEAARQKMQERAEKHRGKGHDHGPKGDRGPKGEDGPMGWWFN